MKHIKPYQLFENNQEPQHPGFPETEDKIHELCKKYDIKNYTINEDLSIDVDNGVILWGQLKFIPLNFNYVSSYFYCSGNKLTSLEGSPERINGYFDCSHNELTSLKYAPQQITSNYFICSYNNIMSLEYIPSSIDYTNTLFEHNPIYSLFNTFIENDNVEDLIPEFNEYSIIRGDKVILNRLKTFISDFDLKMPNLVEVKKHYTIIR